jgi:tetratricopeptide (TPR) repeat protein
MSTMWPFSNKKKENESAVSVAQAREPLAALRQPPVHPRPLMKTEPPALSEDFQRLYCDAAVFENFSEWHPIRLTRIPPFQAEDPVTDNPALLAAEMAHLASPNLTTRLAVVEAMGQCGLLPAEEVARLKPVLDYYDADFFELVGDIYANAGMFICALRWYREAIAALETQNSAARSDHEDVYANVGYCLYSLGLFAEAGAWSKSCIGPALITDVVGAALVDYQAQLAGGRLLATERAANSTRYVASTQNPEFTAQSIEHLKTALKEFTPFQETYLAWIPADAPAPTKPADGYPFKIEADSGCLPRHKMNLLLTLCAQADAMAARGCQAEARRLLEEAAMIEPQAEFVQEKLKVLR